MPSQLEIQKRLNEEKNAFNPLEEARRKYLQDLFEYTKRNVIAYYSGWLQSFDGNGDFAINDHDKLGFMSCCHNLDRSSGLDLILHTPGGQIAATESIVDYLRKMFSDIRVIVPQLAMSAGTMIACSANRVLMGKQSSLGPIDPQISGIPAHGVLEEFETAFREIKADPAKSEVWQPILVKYQPTFIGECDKAVKWSKQLVKEWLQDRMLASNLNKESIADAIIGELADHSVSLNHARHYPAEKCRDLGMVIEMLEDDDELQDKVLSVHHCYMMTITERTVNKIIENHNGSSMFKSLRKI